MCNHSEAKPCLPCRWTLLTLLLSVAGCDGSDDGGPGGSSQEVATSPVSVSSGLSFISISAGNDHSCAIETGGQTYCWGSNEDGKLGTTASLTTCGSVPCGGPVAVEGGQRFVTLTAGQRHTCGLTATGEAYCWGFGLGGQLGDGRRENSSVPVPVAGGLQFAAISSGIGSSATCGITNSGEIWCWGVNGRGQFGNGTTQNSDVPTPTTTSQAQNAIAVTNIHTCSTTTDGDALCWGNNWVGQLGVGSAGASNGLSESLTPTLVLGGLSFREITTGFGHSCALTDIGEAYCWGDSSMTGTASSLTSPPETIPAPVATSLRFQSIDSGAQHTCALSQSGEPYCWGLNGLGALGDDSLRSSRSPVAVAGGHTFATVSAGGNHTCGIALNGEAFCWGNNSARQVGGR